MNPLAQQSRMLYQAALVVFLVTDSAILKRISTPVLGLALIWAIVTAVPALNRSRVA